MATEKKAVSPAADPKDFEKRVKVRPMRLEDLEPVQALQLLCFPGMKPWTKEQIESQLSRFPEGQLVIELDGKIVASSNSLIVDFSHYSDWHNWKEISDNGSIRNHDPAGDTLYGIEIMVSPDFRGMRLARRLYEARKKLARDLNLKRIVIGGRIPGYGAHADKMTAREYVEKVIDKTLVDPVLTPQLANGFDLEELIPDYFPADSESRGYATHLEWNNFDHVSKERRRQQRPVAPVRLCAVQYQMRRIQSFEEFSRQCEFFVDVSADYQSDFVVFPELFTTQLLSLLPPERPGLGARRLADFTPQYLELFTKLAVKYNVNVVGGSHFTVEGDKLYNTAFLFRRDGTVARQHKLHITPNERRWWGVTPGDRLEVFRTDRGRVAIFVCYDIEFPELARLAAAQGARLFIVPYNVDERSGYLRVRHCAQARCVENHAYAVLSGCVGNLPQVENADIHYAQSAILAPADFCFARDGVIGECSPNVETVIIQDVDLEVLSRHRQTGTTRNWNDRRTDLYRVVFKGPDGKLEI